MKLKAHVSCNANDGDSLSRLLAQTELDVHVAREHLRTRLMDRDRTAERQQRDAIKAKQAAFKRSVEHERERRNAMLALGAPSRQRCAEDKASSYVIPRAVEELVHPPPPGSVPAPHRFVRALVATLVLMCSGWSTWVVAESRAESMSLPSVLNMAEITITKAKLELHEERLAEVTREVQAARSLVDAAMSLVAERESRPQVVVAPTPPPKARQKTGKATRSKKIRKGKRRTPRGLKIRLDYFR